VSWAGNDIAAVCHRGLPAGDLLVRVRDLLRRVVPFDGCFMAATDPATTLFMSAAVVEGLPPECCRPYFDNEFLVDDVNKFVALAAGARLDTMHRATNGRVATSDRNNTINAPLGFGPELRAAFTASGGSWGVANLLRERGSPDFTERELAFVRSVSGHIAEGLRAALRDAPPPGLGAASDDDPAVLVFGADGAVASATDAAHRALAGLDGRRFDDRRGTTIPGVAYIVVAQARALAAGRGGPPARARVQDRAGRWLTLSASCPRDAEGAAAQTVLVIEPARPAQIVPIIVQAYDLTAREQEVVALLARGYSNDAIARELWISRHTVKDHVKAVLAKVDVDGRQALLAKLFHDDLQPSMGNH
jgi:DNA-binding CsgD family transcriptional regulator